RISFVWYSFWHSKTPHLLDSIPYCLTNGVQFKSASPAFILSKNNTLYNTLSPASGKSTLLPTSKKARINTGFFEDLKRLFSPEISVFHGSNPVKRAMIG
ncbi:MAG: hypothetical protein UGF91_00080, partial [Dialister invisus]|nr:hypothetical protein [Dialister invisus]